MGRHLYGPRRALFLQNNKRRDPRIITPQKFHRLLSVTNVIYQNIVQRARGSRDGHVIFWIDESEITQPPEDSRQLPLLLAVIQGFQNLVVGGLQTEAVLVGIDLAAKFGGLIGEVLLMLV